MENIDVPTITIVLSILGAVLWLDRKITNVRTELKVDIQRVEDKSEAAHKGINTRLDVLSGQVSHIDKQVATLTARVDCDDDKIDNIQRCLDGAK